MLIRKYVDSCWCGVSEEGHTSLTPYGFSIVSYVKPTDDNEVVQTDNFHYSQKCVGHVCERFARDSKMVYFNGRQWMTQLPPDTPNAIINKYESIVKKKSEKEEEQKMLYNRQFPLCQVNKMLKYEESDTLSPNDGDSCIDYDEEMELSTDNMFFETNIYDLFGCGYIFNH
jgi:hypothetical protein